jgi:protein phosphatase methylesterase 1
VNLIWVFNRPCYFPFRGHGSTITIDDTDLSEETLANDICDVIENFTQSFGNSSPDVVLVGHSMGGALAVHAALAEKPIANLVRPSVIII